MTTTSKVESVLNTREWSWPNGAVFYIQMKLENWETITLGKKDKSAFKAGDEVRYEVVEPGKKWKEVKEMPQFVRRPNNSDNNKWAMIGMAIKTAFELVYKDEKDFDKAKDLAKQILLLALEMHGENKEELPS